MAELEIAKELKERMSYVAVDYERESAAVKQDPRVVEKRYALPDGSTLYLGAERFQTAEALFNPSVLGKEVGTSYHD